MSSDRDIWLCAGQSNMAMPVSQTADADVAEELASAVDVRIRRNGTWTDITPANVQTMPAVPFFFAAELCALQNKPIAVVVAAKGGTGIEAWLPREAFPDTVRGRTLGPVADDPAASQAAEEDEVKFLPYGQHRLARWGLGRALPEALFRTVVEPLVGIPIDGILWYQGESNADTLEIAREYRTWLEALIETYRASWGDPKLPFAVVQLPEYRPDSHDGRAAWKLLQEAQASAVESTTGTALVATTGLGDLGDIHPKQKCDVGRRAAQVACALQNTKNNERPER
ncbi:MAG: hypothetical protein HN976_34570 [Lentisphaerae bacterium]|mgnify:FL=1|jgi:sialate O-acetylesterase|nr:hypothetical protein [Lentisphaerota bacterium]